MFCQKVLLASLLASFSLTAGQVRTASQGARPAPPAAFSGTSALGFTRRAVSFGPRPAGSAAIKKLQSYILSELKLRSCAITEDTFTARTPLGPIAMMNIIVHFPGTSGKAVAFTGHYDTKSMPGTFFVGANDGGASTGFLLEMARVLSERPHKDDVYLVWFDGEEAFGQWSATDGIYGSRHLAQKWADDGTLRTLRALINVDMIGDKNLGILKELNSSPSLIRLVWQSAQQLGYGKYFLDRGGAIEDDHMPFVRLGVNAIDLIDFDYGPDNSYWHTDRDTLDKLSPESFKAVGDVLLDVLRKLENPAPTALR